MKATRIILRLLTLVLTISAALVILVGGLWYVWQGARSSAPDSGYAITARNIERTVLGLYLRQHADQVDTPASPGSEALVTFVVDSGQSSPPLQQLLDAGLITTPTSSAGSSNTGADEDIQAGAIASAPA